MKPFSILNGKDIDLEENMANFQENEYASYTPIISNNIQSIDNISYKNPRHEELIFQSGLRCQEAMLAYRCKDMLLDKKNAHTEKMLILKENQKIRREFLNYGIFEDSDGYLCKELKDAQGYSKNKMRICKIPKLRLIHYTSFFHEKKYSIWQISWNGELQNIYIPEDKMTPEKLIVTLASHGCALQTSREHAKNLYNLVLVYLIQNEDKKSIPHTSGWNKTRDDNWYFVFDSEKTMEGILKCIK